MTLLKLTYLRMPHCACVVCVCVCVHVCVMKFWHMVYHTLAILAHTYTHSLTHMYTHAHTHAYIVHIMPHSHTFSLTSYHDISYISLSLSLSLSLIHTTHLQKMAQMVDLKLSTQPLAYPTRARLCPLTTEALRSLTEET